VLAGAARRWAGLRGAARYGDVLADASIWRMVDGYVEEDGTVVVPAEVLRAANLFPGDRLAVELSADGAIMMHATGAPQAMALELDAAADDPEPMSTDEFMAWLDVMAGIPGDRE
jgi:antitoxin component of MazEF toxin-antitoxin module